MRNLATILVVGLALLATPASADTKRDIAKCAAVKDGIKRLECYDGLARDLGVDKPATTTQTKGKWTVSTEKSPIDDSTNVYMYVESNEPIRGMFGQTVKPVLLIRCKEKTTSLYIRWDVFLGTDETYMTHRIDDQKAVTSEWSISTDNKAAGLWRGTTSISFIKELFGKSRFLVQVTPYGDSPVLATFDVAGLGEAIAPLRKACGW